MAGLINFEDENEVKEFLDNLGMEYNFQCYKEKDPEGNINLRCSRTNSAETLTKTTKRMFNECVLSQRPIFCCVLGCQRLADYLEGVKKNYEATAQVLKHNCDVNSFGESCYKLGAYHVTGKGK